MDRAEARSTDAASGAASTVEMDCPVQCGQPSNRGQKQDTTASILIYSIEDASCDCVRAPVQWTSLSAQQ